MRDVLTVGKRKERRRELGVGTEIGIYKRGECKGMLAMRSDCGMTSIKLSSRSSAS
jgi:hypothetical protein